MFANAVVASLPPLRLGTEPLLVSYLLKSAGFAGLEVPPWIVSFAICIEAGDFGTRGQDPYQLLALLTCEVEAGLLGVEGLNEEPSADCCDSFRNDALASFTRSCCDTGWELAGVADTVVGTGVDPGVVVEALLACDVVVDCEGIVGGRLVEEPPPAAAGLGFARFRGAMLEICSPRQSPEQS